MLDTAQLAALAAVVRHGSFDAAASALHVTSSAISQRIKALEDRVGATLVRRGSPCTATDIGARLARHFEDIAMLDTALHKEIGKDAAPAHLRCAVNADTLATWFMPALRGTDMLIDLVVDDQDHSADWLRRGEVSAAITGDAGPVQGCDSYPLGALVYRATASSDYYAEHFPDGVTAEALEQAPALLFSAKDSLQQRWVERITGRRIPLRSHVIPSSQGFVTAALLGLGWGMNPAMLVDNQISKGNLVDLAPDTPIYTPLYWQVNRLVAEPLKGLTTAIRNRAERLLQPLENIPSAK